MEKGTHQYDAHRLLPPASGRGTRREDVTCNMRLGSRPQAPPTPVIAYERTYSWTEEPLKGLAPFRSATSFCGEKLPTGKRKTHSGSSAHPLCYQNLKVRTTWLRVVSCVRLVRAHPGLDLHPFPCSGKRAENETWSTWCAFFRIIQTDRDDQGRCGVTGYRLIGYGIYWFCVCAHAFFHIGAMMCTVFFR